MMLPDDLGHRPRKLNLLQDIVSRLGVHLDQVSFRFGEGEGLAQNFRGNGDLSDVVKGRRHPDAVDDLPGEPHLRCDRSCQIGDPSVVARFVLIL